MSERTASTFRLAYAVENVIAAPPSEVWARLTDADAFPSWNSTVSQLKGPIAAGIKLAIQVPVAPGRTFRPTVTEFEAPRRMVWSDGFAMFRGRRTFTLTPEGERTRFRMEEVFSGLMLPMIKGSLPEFGPVFDAYAADLKRACED
ncbi:MAG: SRPBCC domain-containing protein [Pseudolysinimonas sp.]